jgi:hypothetical protein
MLQSCIGCRMEASSGIIIANDPYLECFEHGPLALKTWCCR